MTRRLAVLAAVLLTAVGLVATPAQASGLADCPGGYVCAWDNSDWTGLLFRIAGLSGTCHNVPSGTNDRANAFMNHRNDLKHVQMYKDANCTGPLLRNWNGWTGPFPAYADPNSYSLFYKTICCANDQDKLSSIFFNTG
jgi:hypothetical protein